MFCFETAGNAFAHSLVQAGGHFVILVRDSRRVCSLLYTHDCDVGDNPSKHQYGTLGVPGEKRKKRSGEPPAGATVPFSLEAQHCGKASEIEA